MDTTRSLLVEADRFLTEREGEVIALTSALVAAPSPNLPGDETAPAAVIERALAHADSGLALMRRRPTFHA